MRRRASTGFFITDDNFARNKDWEGILDRLIWLREEQGFKFKADAAGRHAVPSIPRLHREGGAAAAAPACSSGLRISTRTRSLAAKKRQNKIWEYRKMLQAWKDAGVITYAGYILGFPNDTPEKIARNIEIIQREMPLDLIEFFFLTPLPGSEDHKVLHAKGVWMDPDLNKYDLNHRVTHHPIMSGRGMGEGLFRFLAAVLYAQARRDRAQARRGARQAHQRSLFLGRAFSRRDPHREGAPARMRHRPAQDPHSSAGRE